MLIFDINDILVFVHETPTSPFDIRIFIHFATGDTQLAKSLELQHAIIQPTLAAIFETAMQPPCALSPENVLHTLVFSQAPPFYNTEGVK